ncbi:MAG: protein rep [Deltaproteobacteria bacterium]|nr:protein rep [Deltaproteobacteria bacterium]
MELDGERRELAGRLLREDWLADPQKAADKLTTCSSAWGVGVRVQGGSAAVESVPYGCKDPLCPACSHQRAGRRVSKWLGVIGELQARGYSVLHLTTTQPAIEGEGLGEAIARLHKAWRGVRQNRSTRDWWRGSVLGDLRGREWTGKNRQGSRRWHVHMHTVIVLRPGVDSGEWFEQWLRIWENASDGAQEWGQDCNVIEGTEADRLGALREVLKYPFKAGDLSDWQILEVLAETKGMRHQEAGTGFRANSAIGAAVKSGDFGELEDHDQEAAADLSAAYEIGRKKDGVFAALYLNTKELDAPQPSELDDGRDFAAELAAHRDTRPELDEKSPAEGFGRLTHGVLEMLAEQRRKRLGVYVYTRAGRMESLGELVVLDMLRRSREATPRELRKDEGPDEGLQALRPIRRLVALDAEGALGRADVDVVRDPQQPPPELPTSAA